LKVEHGKIMADAALVGLSPSFQVSKLKMQAAGVQHLFFPL